MKSLLIKDFYCMKVYIKQYLLMLLFFLIFAVFLKSPAYMILMLMMCVMIWVLGSLSADEAGGFSYELSLPVDRTSIVKAKYAWILIFYLISFVFLAAGALVMAAVNGNVAEWVWSIVIVTAVYSLLLEVILPVSFKFGTQRARLAIMGIVLIPALLVFVVAKLFPKSLPQPDTLAKISPWAVGIGILLFCVAAFLVSYTISKKVFLKKEF